MQFSRALIRSAAVPLFLSLAACTDQDWSHALTFVGMGARAEKPPVRPASPKAVAEATVPGAQNQPSSAKPNSFCEAVAEQDAQGNDFDAATQKRVLIKSYRQCVAIFGSATQ